MTKLIIQIPCFNEEESLPVTLQELPREVAGVDHVEWLVVDDGSPQRLDAVVAPFQDRLDLTFLRQANAGPAAARNAGARRARGSYLTFTDDDCAPAPAWLRALATQFARTPDALVGGRTVNALHDNMYAEASQQLIDYLLHKGTAATPLLYLQQLRRAGGPVP